MVTVLTVLVTLVLAFAASKINVSFKPKRAKATFAERWVLANGKKVRVSVASYGAVYMGTTDATVLAGHAVRATEKKMIYVGKLSHGRQGAVVTYSNWFAETSGIDFSLLWTASDLAPKRELELNECGDWAASNPDEGRTEDENTSATLEDELVKALKMAATPAKNPLEALAARTPAQRLRDGE